MPRSQGPLLNIGGGERIGGCAGTLLLIVIGLVLVLITFVLLSPWIWGTLFIKFSQAESQCHFFRASASITLLVRIWTLSHGLRKNLLI